MSRRVVVTGMGAITPIGNNVKDFWSSIKAGKVGVGEITLFDSSDYKVHIAAEVKGFTPAEFLEKKQVRRLDRFCQFAMVAAKEAIEDSGIELDRIDPYRFGVIVGSGIGGLETIEKQAVALHERGSNGVSPMFIPMVIGNMAAGNISIKYGLKGYNSCAVTACSSGTHSIGDAFELIKNGKADMMLAGGAEAAICPLGLVGFTNITALTNETDPMKASIPFDKNRSGFVIGEGSGMLVLEEYESAKTRGAKIYAEVLGYGATADAYHITAPSPEGESAGRAMVEAISEAGIKCTDLNYINAHGTSTPHNDRTETRAIKEALGEAAYKVKISSTKGMTGHLLGGAGAIEAIVIAKAIEEGFVPATVGLSEADPECDLDYVPGKGIEMKVEYAMSNSLGFGGHNGSILFGKVKEYENR